MTEFKDEQKIYPYQSVIRKPMKPWTKMRLIMGPMIIMVFVGLKTFLDHHLVVLPIVCIVAFATCFILLVRWNVERLRGS